MGRRRTPTGEGDESQSMGDTLDVSSERTASASGGSETASLTHAQVEIGSRQKFGDFELLGELGRGGMGVVYKARQTNPERLVALKTTRTDLVGEIHRQRFNLEAEAVANLNHPNIVPLWEAGERDGHLFYTMPLIEGRTLARAIDEEEWSIRDAVTLVAKLADAMAHAHQHRVLHRDLKPANILLDQRGEPFVADFGLAKHLDAPEQDLTMSGDVVGSPSYMAPEQARGRSKEVSTATDVYGLGTILYHLVSGQKPFLGESAFDVMQAVVNEEPSQLVSRQGVVDRDLDTIVRKCLEKEASKRYQSADALGTELRRWLDGKPIAARAIGPAERTLKWVRRNRMLSAFLFVSAALSLAAMIAIEDQRRQYRDERARFLEQLIEAKLYQANLELDNRYPGRALARYADILRIDPDQPTARAVIAEQLRNGVYAHLVREPVDTQIEIERLDLQLAVSDDRNVVLVLNRSGQGWEINDAEDRRRPVDFGKGLRYPHFSQDGKWLCFSRFGLGVVVCNTVDWEEQFVLPRQSQSLIAIHPDRTRIALMVRGQGAALWDIAKMSVQDLHWDKPPTNSHHLAIKYDPTGRFFIAGYTHTFSLWDGQSGELRFDYSEATVTEIEDFSFSRDGNLLAWAGTTNTAKIWNVEKEYIVAEHSRQGKIDAICFNHDGTLVASGSRDKVAAVWKSHGGEIVVEFPHGDWVSHVEFDQTGRFLLTTALDNTLRIWDMVAGRPHSEWTHFDSKIVFAGFIGESGHVRVICANGKIYRLAFTAAKPALKLDDYAVRFDFIPGKNELIVGGGSQDGDGGYHWVIGEQNATNKFPAPERVRYAELSPDGNHVQIASYHGLRLWSQDPMGNWSTRPRTVSAYGPFGAFSPDSQSLATVQTVPRTNGMYRGRVQSWSTLDLPNTGGQPLAVNTNHPIQLHAAHKVTFSPDNENFAVATGLRVKLWTSRSNKPFMTFKDGRSGGWLEFSRDGRRLAGAVSGRGGMIWSTATGNRVAEKLIHHGEITCIRFSPDGSLVVTSSKDETAQLWDAASGKPIGSPVRHRDTVNWVAFSPQGDCFATASKDGTARVWDVERQQPVSGPLVHGAPVVHLDFSDDGSWLATASSNGEVRAWKMDEPDLSADAETLIRAAEELGRHRAVENSRVVRIPW